MVEAGAVYDTDSYSTAANAALIVPVPIFNRNQGNILQAQSQVAAAEREVQRVELDLRNRLASTYEQYANARQQVEAYRDHILPNANKSLELTGSGYQQGEFDYLTLLTAQRTYFQANLDYLRSLSQLRARSVELEGLLLSNSLAADN
jgi:cobalt-zinc-cadmium efflux system outer membrane protein